MKNLQVQHAHDLQICACTQGHLSGGVELDIRGAAYIVAVAQPAGCQGGAHSFGWAVNYIK